MPVTFISGHCNITQSEFTEHYRDTIQEASKDPNTQFVVGDCKGVDIMAQQLLLSLVGPDRISVYHLDRKPMYLADKRIRLIGGFRHHEFKDAAMTFASDTDMAWVRPIEDCQRYVRLSGTARNLLRRKIVARHLSVT